MTRISRFPIDEDKLEKLFKLVFEIVGKRHNQEEFDNVICDLFTPVERVMVAKRVAIVYLLLKEIDHRTICRVLKVSSSTVAKFVLLSEKSLGVIPAFKRIVHNEKICELLEDVYSSIFAPGVYGVNWAEAWRRKFNLQRKKEEGL